jgi:subtilase family serine protease
MHIRPTFLALALVSVLLLGLPARSSGNSLAVSPAHAAGNPTIHSLRDLGPLVRLPGSLLPKLRSAHRLPPLVASRSLGLTISLRVRDQAGLDRLLSSLYNRSSPLYHHFLTPEQFARRFAPTAATQQLVIQWLQSKHMRVVQRARNGLLLTVRANLGRLESAFGTRVFQYIQGTHRFFANDRPVQVPQRLASVITAVAGFSDRNRVHSQIREVHTPSKSEDLAGYGPSDLRNLYDLTQFYQNSLNGDGQTIGLYESCDYSQANVATYDNNFGISDTSSATARVMVSDGKDSGAQLDAGQTECELDIEIIHAIAPAAHILVYEAPSTDAGSIALWNKIVSDDAAPIVSTSWGTEETSLSTDVVQAIHQALQEAAAQGQSVFDASGDLGAYDAAGDTNVPDSQWGNLVVDYPAADPYVTSVGGTTLYANADGSYHSEIAWSDASRKPNAGSGGGLSTIFKRPDYQTGPGVSNQYSNGMRQVPDVAADANAQRSPYAIYSVDNQCQAGWLGVGGTSAAAPLWAAYTVLINQYWGQSVGFLNPTLYALGRQASSLSSSPFHDITQGDNLYYPATPGWDFATGWGSMDGVAFANGLLQLGGPVSQ